ncbi:ABC transporter ATP-binding protein [Billgrantia montanilacus]|uniref:ATP-binding cassette domain-containing protein n=1 Tax=Billgrantia montanilacus TaxID=2282305 RepID=A0A368U3J9_9GAMM|nr:ATP-binding cassette domain-containing protein [Halomonas montanilacus]RCV91638.1 ATP-binding cassette domain-containing protein [Halomonas montanilacus]
MLEFAVPGGHPVLAPMSLRIAQGDRICLLGPSGIGKTTLLNRLAGLEPGQPRPALRIGYLFQEHRLLPWRTLHDNLRLVGVRSDQVSSLLSQVGLDGYGAHFPDQLSLGMARRAALARCLAVRPELLLLDEPFASLDPHRATELQALIRKLLDRTPHMAMICVTHELRDAAALANRVWYLAGRPAHLRHDGNLGDTPAAVADLARQLETLGQESSAQVRAQQPRTLGPEAADGQR